jgi:hypothetical protein
MTLFHEILPLLSVSVILNFGNRSLNTKLIHLGGSFQEYALMSKQLSEFDVLNKVLVYSQFLIGSN